MAINNKKIMTEPSASITPAKWPFATKVVESIPASKATTKKVLATPAKKTVAEASKNVAPIPAKKTIATKTEKPISKNAAPPKSTTKKSVKKNTVTPEDRYHMIATAAYFRAEQRGFSGGYEMEDWILGEAQIDAMLNA